MQLVFRRQAEIELLEAQLWYEDCAPGLGMEFARAVDAALTQALRMPLAYPRIEDDFRHVMTRKFPYSLIYVSEDEQMVIISCFHHSRRPGSWKAAPAY
jgi:plasmid stabilization system protein ParE